MYLTQEIAEKIKLQAKSQKIKISVMLADCGLGINTVSEFSKGKEISCISLAKIADRLNCSMDYLMGRTDKPEINQ